MSEQREANVPKRQRYETLVQHCASDLYRFAFWLSGHRQTAEDLVQETFREAWCSLERLRDPARGKAWLLGILRNRYRHHARRQQRRPQPSFNDEALEQVAEVKATADVVELLGRRELVEKGLAQLDERYKEPLLLVLLEGYTCREAAELLALPMGTVLSRIHRGRAILRRALTALERGDAQAGGAA